MNSLRVMENSSYRSLTVYTWFLWVNSMMVFIKWSSLVPNWKKLYTACKDYEIATCKIMATWTLLCKLHLPSFPEWSIPVHRLHSVGCYGSELPSAVASHQMMQSHHLHYKQNTHQPVTIHRGHNWKIRYKYLFLH
jgi:hypothetical protein